MRLHRCCIGYKLASFSLILDSSCVPWNNESIGMSYSLDFTWKVLVQTLCRHHYHSVFDVAAIVELLLLSLLIVECNVVEFLLIWESSQSLRFCCCCYYYCCYWFIMTINMVEMFHADDRFAMMKDLA